MRNRPRAFIAFDEGVVFYQVEQISRRHFKDVCVEKLTTVSGRRYTEGGFEQLDIPDAGSTPIVGNLVLVDLPHLGQGIISYRDPKSVRGLLPVGHPKVGIITPSPTSLIL